MTSIAGLTQYNGIINFSLSFFFFFWAEGGVHIIDPTDVEFNSSTNEKRKACIHMREIHQHYILPARIRNLGKWMRMECLTPGGYVVKVPILLVVYTSLREYRNSVMINVSCSHPFV